MVSKISFYIVDELKYVKKCRRKSDEAKLELVEEYYVNKNFTDNVKHFKLARDMLY